MIDLLKQMQKLTDQYLQAYKTDFSVHDVKQLKEEANKGVFYWLLRRCGTQLYTCDDFEIAGDSWNMLEQLKYYKDNYLKFFQINVEDVKDEKIVGTLKELDYDKTVSLFESNLKEPIYIVFDYKGQICKLEWDKDLSRYDAMESIRDYFERNDIYWNDLKYTFQYE